MGGGVSDKLRHERTMELHKTMHKTKWETATVINMHSFELRHGMGSIGELRIPAKKNNEPYAKFTILRYRVCMRDLGDAKFIPEAVLPVQMAEDICLMASEWGGVFWYRGSGDPSPEELAEAGRMQIAYYEREYVKGQDSWHKKKQIALINDHMRTAAKELYKLGAIASLPEWTSITRSESNRKMCEACGEDVKATAKRCGFCGFVIDLEFFNANKERFQSGDINVNKKSFRVDPIDEGKQKVEDFFSEPYPEAGLQNAKLEKALEPKLPDDLIVKRGRPPLNKEK
jgi:hypothetical protein